MTYSPRCRKLSQLRPSHSVSHFQQHPFSTHQVRLYSLRREISIGRSAPPGRCVLRYTACSDRPLTTASSNTWQAVYPNINVEFLKPTMTMRLTRGTCADLFITPITELPLESPISSDVCHRSLTPRHIGSKIEYIHGRSDPSSAFDAHRPGYTSAWI